jgi:hypothetical protein
MMIHWRTNHLRTNHLRTNHWRTNHWRTNHWRWLLLIAGVALLGGLLLWYYQRTDAQAGANCSAPYLIDKSFANGARWQLCWEQRNLDGIVLRDVYFTAPGGTQHRVLAQGSISQVHVPYDDNSARFHDITDDGFGNENLSDLTPAECPGGTLLRDGSKDVLCQQVQGRGYAAKGLGTAETGEWLSLFSVSTSGEYNYIPVWRFLDDGSLEMEMGATGKLQRFTTTTTFGWPVRSDNTLGTSHIHNYYWRLDFDLGEEGADDLVEEFNYLVETGQATLRRVLGVTQLTTEAGRAIAPQTMRSWRIRDGALTNAHGRAISYELAPMTVAHRDVGPSSEPWTANDFYVTKYNACEKYVSHNPQTNGCGNNLAAFVNGESLANSDLVLWYGVTFHHIPRDEDEPFMHAHWDGFRMTPRDWLDANPAAADLVTCAVGDVTCDATVDAADALFMLQYNVGLRSSSSELPLPAQSLYGYGCDVSGEGACNEVDALLTLQCAVGLTNRFCPDSAGVQSSTAANAPAPATLHIGKATDERAGSTTSHRIPLQLDAAAAGALALTLHYDTATGISLTCETDKAQWDMNLCSVDATNGTVRFSALAAAGAAGAIKVGDIVIDESPSGDQMTTPLFTVETVALVDVTGTALPAQVWQAAMDQQFYLPLIAR